MDTLYPKGPASVPPDLTRASSAYKQRAWMAMAGLSLFIGLYIFLTAWFAWTAWRMLSGLGQGGDFQLVSIAAGAASAFMFIFMVKALFAVKHGNESRDIELQSQDHPQLFDFLNRLADDAGAPRPHKVFVSPQVNAAVFYDLSLLNLIFPSKKNLLIGLGLVNVLNLGEFKAVLAHEFGHFAQRSMAVGRWVYVAQQIAAHIIAKRDALDKFLQGLSRVDFRIAWIGWILSLVVWSIRSLLDSVFSIVILSERALSRQMEFQADLVAVSLTGSDALVHALNKLHAGDDAWSRTLNFANQEIGEGRKVQDLFAVQSQILLQLRKIYSDQDYGCVPDIPQIDPAKHRVFTSNIASPPQMWSTHPENTAREDNAKNLYIPCDIDTRDAWVIFNNKDALRETVSAHLFSAVEKELKDVSLEESLKNLNRNYSKPWLLPCYRGTYLGRSITRKSASFSECFNSDNPDPSISDLDALYPEALTDKLENLRELYEEKHHLEALRDKIMKAAGGIIQFRGDTIKHKDLPKVIADVQKEIDALENDLHSHDKQVRSVHLAAANKVGEGWHDYLKGLLALLHFADHSEADIQDVNGYVVNVWSVITADGRISNAETKRLIEAVSDAHSTMNVIFSKICEINLDAGLLKKLETEKLSELIGDYNLPAPQRDNINEWMNVYDGWIAAFSYTLSNLKFVTLETLLLAEAKVAGALRQNKTLDPAPTAPTVPQGYKTLLPGSERQLQKKLDLWDSFFTATGFFPATARFVVATSIVGAVLWFGQSLGNTAITVYNGLDRYVQVEINGKSRRIQPHGSASLELAPGKDLNVVTKTDQGHLIENFTQKSTSSSYQQAVYNVAGAAPLVKWWAVYGDVRERENEYLGAPKWINHSADYYFSEPPDNIETSGSGGHRSVLGGYGELSPYRQLNMIENGQQAQQVIEMHARWDRTDSPFILHWLAYLSRQQNAKDILQARLQDNPNSVVLLRMEQELYEGEQKTALCDRHKSLASNAPDNADFAYLTIRCMEDGPEQDKAFEEGLAQWPSHPWFALANGYRHAQQGDWPLAMQHYQTATGNFPPLKASLSSEIVRMARLLNSDIDYYEFAQLNDQVYYTLALEDGREFSGSPAVAYSHLYRGELTEALQVAQGDPEVYNVVLSFAASSDGADPEWINQALQIDPEVLNYEASSWALFALALREENDVSLHKAFLENNKEEYVSQLMNFMDALKKKASIQRAEEHIQSIPPYARGHAYAMAAIFLQENCPTNWRQQASALLFANERPFIKI